VRGRRGVGSNKFTKRTYSIEICELFSMVIFFSTVNVRKKNIDDNDVQMFSFQRPESHVPML
jgi:hypothetical protein